MLGIDPEGVVHIARRLLDETDGPVLRTGLQGFHGQAIMLPRRPEDRPDPARLEVRFDRFERAASSSHYGGLGLGLFISREIVEALGGTIAVESSPGGGAEFTVTLPLRRTAQ